MAREPVVLVGAFERDNFGDQLFAIYSQKYLDDYPTRLTAPFAGEADHLLGAKVEPYAHAIAKQPPKAVWVVGGEVGGVTLDIAFVMSSNESTYRRIGRLRSNERLSELEHLTGLSRFSVAYLPRMSAFEETMGAVCVVNSVGLRWDD